MNFLFVKLLVYIFATIHFSVSLAATSGETATEEVPGTRCITAPDTLAGGACRAHAINTNQFGTDGIAGMPGITERDISILRDEVVSRLETLGKVCMG
eukprot:jgi/Mesvir1/15938/Mv26459-RA.1